MTTGDQTRMVTTGVAARAIGVHPATLQRWADSGYVQPAYRTRGRHMRWNIATLQAQLRARTAENDGGQPPVDDPSRPVEQPVVAAILTSDLGMLVTWRTDKTPPAGFLTGEIEPGESPADAMVRECKEEAGMIVVADKVIAERIHPRTGRRMVYVSGEASSTQVAVEDDSELTAIRWVTLAEADEAMAPFGGIYAPVRDYLEAKLQ